MRRGSGTTVIEATRQSDVAVKRVKP